MTHRVAITGMGVVSPIGCGVQRFLESLLAGTSGGGPITIFEPASLATRIAAQVQESFDDFGLADRKVAFAMEALRQAWEAATACGTRPGGDAAGQDASLSLGIGLELFSMPKLVDSRRPGFRPPEAPLERLTFLQTPADLTVHLISARHGLRQPPLTHVSACAAGTDAIGAAFRLVASGRRRWMFAGGADSMINPLGVAGFCKIAATTTANGDPKGASRPFDARRDGFLLGEGAAMLVLERLEDAQARGAHLHAEVCGYGNSFDAHGISEPHPDGRGAFQAMTRALAEAGIAPEAIDSVNAHGTSTPKNDRIETAALKRLLGERAHRVPVCATKSMIGHLISAAGAVEAVAAAACMEAGWVHPTINLEKPDPACDLDYVAGAARRCEQRYVLSNSFGFGGQNASLVLRNAREAP
ncbi:MAG: beta-ketoacyl-[acyl-carrier-protein] synthase family protein [Candidatus Wallbacteria bacterium]|nr:beta-ketoacyl-[acyl-carrier-protein] synthase family protein [Candidatus Wallbacteria bacterium]